MTRSNRTAATASARRKARVLGLGTVALVALAGAAQAGANPALPMPPIAALSATPNPVVVPGQPQLAPLTAIRIGSLVNFSAVGSFDPNGTVIGYDWDLDGNPGYERSTAGPTTTHRYLASGPLIVRVRVRDNQGLSAARTLLLVRHTAPVARPTASVPVALVGDGITFSGAQSTDDGSITKHEWDLDGDGTFERTGVQVATSFGAPGSRQVTLRVTDNHGVTRTAKTTVRIHERPTAAFTTSPLVPVAGTPTTLDAASSSDDGSIVKYEWDLDGNGSYERDSGAVASVQHTFAAIGPARVGLRVTDNDGQTDTASLTVQVAQTPQPAADRTAPRLVPLTRTLRMSRDGRVSVRLRCPAVEQTCTATVRLVGRGRPVQGRALGTARRVLPGGRTMTLPLRLNAAARNRVTRNRVVTANAIVRAVDAAGNARTTTTAVTIRR